MIRGKEIIFAHPNREEGEFIASGFYLNKGAFSEFIQGVYPGESGGKKRKKFF